MLTRFHAPAARAVRRAAGLGLLSALALLNASGARAEAAINYVPRGQAAIDRYVAAPDANFAWKVVSTNTDEGGVTTTVIDLTSQQWRSAAEVDHPIWKHSLLIARPAGVTADTAFIFIDGGSIGGEHPKDMDKQFKSIAKETGSILCEIKQIPNEPLEFADEPGRKRSEDGIIAYSWDKYMKTGDETWPLRLPMVKSVVRAMDAAQAYLASPEGGAVKVEHFVAAGGSKRGWTTWMTAAVDPRIVAISPIVIDVLNSSVSMMHHRKVYGFWAPAVGDYSNQGIQDKIGTPEHDALMRIEDPYFYMNRFTMPKYVINASGDEFFLPDSSQFYYGELPGEKRLRYVPNSGHSLGGTDVHMGLAAWYWAILNHKPLPEYSWTKKPDGTLVAKSAATPKEVKVWQAINPAARDFRVATIGKAYKATPLEPQADRSYVARPATPEQGWSAFFIELTYDLGFKFPIKFTTEVSVIPDTIPSEDPRPKGELPSKGEGAAPAGVPAAPAASAGAKKLPFAP